MARERDDEFEDDYDDRPRPRRDRDRDRDDEGPEIPGNASAGRAKARTPGLFLALLAGLALTFGVAQLAVNLTSPGLLSDPIFDAMIDFTKKQPANPQQAGQIAQFEQQKLDARNVNPVNVVFGIIGLAMNAVSLLGGMQLRATKGYGLALTGSILALIPLGGCCCLTMPVGLWALITVLNQDVKAAFAASKSGRVADLRD